MSNCISFWNRHCRLLIIPQKRLRSLETVVSLAVLMVPIMCAHSMAQASPRPTLLEFFGPGCKPCAEMAPVIARAKKRHAANVEFVAVDVADSKNAELIEKYGITAVPTLVAVDEKGDMVALSEGLTGPGQVEQMIRQIASP